MDNGTRTIEGTGANKVNYQQDLSTLSSTSLLLRIPSQTNEYEADESLKILGQDVL